VEKLGLYVLIFDKLKWIHTFRLFPFYEYSAICSMTRIIYIIKPHGKAVLFMFFHCVLNNQSNVARTWRRNKAKMIIRILCHL